MLAILTCQIVEIANLAYPHPVFWKSFFRKVEQATTNTLVDIFRKGAEFSRDIGRRNASADEENVLIRLKLSLPPQKLGAIDLLRA